MTTSLQERSEVGELVAAAVHGDQQSWNAIVERYAPLVRSIALRYRLSANDVEDVSQTLWLTLVNHLSDLREPRALPGWITTTTRNLVWRALATQRTTVPVDPSHQESVLTLDAVDNGNLDEQLLREERRQAIREGLDELPNAQRQLLLLLAQDPPLPYQEISRRLGIPVGSIGPTRARCMARLRGTTAVRALFPEQAPTEAKTRPQRTDLPSNQDHSPSVNRRKLISRRELTSASAA